MKRIAITTGDVDGIGLEITQKALRELGPQNGFQFLVWTAANTTTDSNLYGSKFKVQKVNDVNRGLSTNLESTHLIEISSKQDPAAWVAEVSLLALQGEIAALCTGPLSKNHPSFKGGHTEYFRTLVKDDLFMFFIGESFKVLLATDHIALCQVAPRLNSLLIHSALTKLQAFLDRHFPKEAHKPIGILGLNPHAGEKSLLGQEETQILEPLIHKLKGSIKIEGPLVPDVAFRQDQWSRFSSYLAMYHDQGLIPFKMIHSSGTGTHLTLGLPFIRTSVDHGTAKDLFGKNQADPGSMRSAIEWALRLTHSL
ncbi:MAG: 4-hydroxythreonine-4-phosphate dehydrogenase PdxA [Bdellovibrionales bacterium]|nr:4-hydroxythreonine-4-phosphate dehydrogenase PdxA [Bdellovibrionales bacterium]